MQAGERVSRQTVAGGRIKHSVNFIGNKSIVEIVEANRALRFSCFDIDAGQSVAAPLQVGVEIHPAATKCRQLISMPKKPRQPIKLMRRIQSIPQAVFDVSRRATNHSIAKTGADVAPA